MPPKLLLLFTLLAPFTVIAVQPQFTDEEKLYLIGSNEILMCIDPNWMPYEKIDDGKHIGMSYDYMKLFSERIGLPITLVPTTTWTQSIEYAKSRKCDIFSLAMSTPERTEYMNFTKPYLSIPLVIATRIEDLFIVDIVDVQSKKLGIVKGYAFVELLRLKYPGINLIEVSSLDEGLERVAAGELYGFVGTLSSIGYSIQRNFIGELKVAGKFDEKWELGVGVRNDDRMLLSVFEKAIDSVEYETRQKIMSKWVSVKYDKGIDYQLAWQVLAGLSLVILIFMYRQFELMKYNKKLEELSTTDKLTGLFNRMKIDESIQNEIDLYNRYTTTFCILILDLDLFKNVNDKYGHQAGDSVLVETASVLKKCLRKTDMIGRWGGEEFLIVLPKTEDKKALELASRIRQSIQDNDLMIEYGVTTSIGVSQMNTSDNFTQLIKRADDALYSAKESGRNRVEFFNAVQGE